MRGTATAGGLVVAGGAGLEAVELVGPAETIAADGARVEIGQDEDVGPSVEPVAVVDAEVGEARPSEGHGEPIVVEERVDARDGDGGRPGGSRRRRTGGGRARRASGDHRGGWRSRRNRAGRRRRAERRTSGRRRRGGR